MPRANVTFWKRRRRRKPVPTLGHNPPHHERAPLTPRRAPRYGLVDGGFAYIRYTRTGLRSRYPINHRGGADPGPSAVRRRSYFTGQFAGRPCQTSHTRPNTTRTHVYVYCPVILYYIYPRRTRICALEPKPQQTHRRRHRRIQDGHF